MIRKEKENIVSDDKILYMKNVFIVSCLILKLPKQYFIFVSHKLLANCATSFYDNSANFFITNCTTKNAFNLNLLSANLRTAS